MNKERHLITIYPSVMWGQPTVDHHRITAEHMAGAWWSGLTLEEIEKSWPGMNKGAVLVACWYMARYGSRTWRKRWGEWLAFEADKKLWDGHYDTCQMPPQKQAVLER